LLTVRKAGADTTKLDSRQETALQWAEANKEEECVNLLKKAAK
jgi:ankyrin repeat protein